MNNYMLPTDDEFVEEVAKAIAKDRLHRDASHALEEMIGIKIQDTEVLENSFERVFNILWNGSTPVDIKNREEYRADARAAISAINLKILTRTME